ncbi:SepM family pheromone-processing serine protease [Bacillus sp. FSL W7-1360]
MEKTIIKKFSWKRWVVLFIILLLLGWIKIPYYYSQPGMAEPLTEMVHVDGSKKEHSGTFMLTTIQTAHATPLLAAWSYLSPFRSLHPAPEELTDEEYDERQRVMMEISQDNAKIAAYTASSHGRVNITNNGVYVSSIVKGMAAEGYLKSGDVIKQINGQDVKTAEELLEVLSSYEEGDTVSVTFRRAGVAKTESLTFAKLPAREGEISKRAGIGIQGPLTDRTVTFVPDVEITAGAIGGPSAGLMFSLEVYQQLSSENLTKGHCIAGTGTIDEMGRVGPIGGANQKVVAADDEGAAYFFVPHQYGAPNSNYVEAKKAAEAIGTEMDIVPVDTLQDALTFLKTLPEKTEGCSKRS